MLVYQRVPHVWSPRLPQASSTSPAVASAVVLFSAAGASADARGGGADGGASSEGFRGGSWQIMGNSWEYSGNIVGIWQTGRIEWGIFIRMTSRIEW